MSLLLLGRERLVWRPKRGVQLLSQQAHLVVDLYELRARLRLASHDLDQSVDVVAQLL
ncbi:hypothetical protein [Micromonospora sp. DH14]|uniref:hypothetical protein n=1 Tax=Micromonospora sp. DH14 TaxID=3040120 RepID=UPI002443476E|nr:hypothetical protein [Micromonospora sp. DH14]MDG9678028.1 hypothetical protein [Micromonospora sp. DH14]